MPIFAISGVIISDFFVMKGEKLLKTADLCDKHSEHLHICTTTFRSFGSIPAFNGPIRTVKVIDDNVLVLQALEDIPAGSVLVVDGDGSRQCALLGDRLAGIAADRKLAGVIIHGCVRDAAELAQTNVGVFALGTMPKKSAKNGLGERDVPLTFGGITWTPGHYAYADEDGVVVSETSLSL